MNVPLEQLDLPTLVSLYWQRAKDDLFHVQQTAREEKTTPEHTEDDNGPAPRG